METLTVPTPDGFGIAVQLAGPAEGPPLLLLAGQANNHHWWDHVRGGFEDRWRTISLDQRGTGDSRGPVTEWSTRLFAADAAAVVEHLVGGPVPVYGTSMGGRVAQVLAGEHPELVDRLVLACTSPGGAHAHERDAAVRRELAHPDAAHRRAVLRDLFYTDAWPHRPEDSVLFGDRAMSADETRAHLRASARHDAWDLLPRITAPTLVLHGTDDRMVPTANAPLLAERIPGALLHLHEGGRHGFFEESATDITPLVREFLE
ncbi:MULTISPECIES: alpha/beta fold hydrolase [unclassified Nocardioides]|uniref:alpha/beta fold hydrolase n=1 Tax=unclassified Nocardioides TaxID=2615069 RepID=UPI0030152DC7